MKFGTSTPIATCLMMATAVNAAQSDQQLRGANDPERNLQQCSDVNIDFNNFNAGDKITSAGLGGYAGLADIKLLKASHSCMTDAPVVFDSANPTCGDGDLKSKHDGKALIIQQQSTCVPNDCRSGGEILFAWNAPITLNKIRFLDADEKIELYVKESLGNDFVKLADPPLTANKKHLTHNVNHGEVVELKVVFQGTGAIANVSYNKCPRNPGGGGDPHFRSWTGGEFDYHGECDLEFLRSENFHNGDGLEIQIRTEHEDWYSFISDAAIRIGSDILELAGEGKFVFNGESSSDLAALPVDIAGYHLEHYTKEREEATEYFYDIHLNDSEYIRVRSFKHFVFVTFAPGVYNELSDSVGLMGNWETGALVGRDGETEMEEWALGPEWQVKEEPNLFLADRYPQFPKQCIPPKWEAEKAIEVSVISKEQAVTACAHWGTEQERCIFDVRATGDIDLAKLGRYFRRAL